jgi:D-alanyl-D-alanine carboxypeptidase
MSTTFVRCNNAPRAWHARPISAGIAAQSGKWLALRQIPPRQSWTLRRFGHYLPHLDLRISDPMPFQHLLRSRRLFAVLLLGIAAIRPAAAQVGSDRYSSIVIDAATGTVLSAVNPDEYRFPASLTKMMTLYMLFEAIRDRRVSLQQYVPVSPSAASMPPTKLGLVPGSLITVEQAIMGLVTKSANDAAAALGEMLGGDEERFAQMMTLRARALGMSRTTFQNASGLPDWNQVTTARDMATLSRRLIQDFPGFYHYFSTPAFAYGGRYIRTHQALLTTYAGADGLKTGYTDASGYNVATSALRGETRLIGIVLGAASSGERNAHMATLMDQGFERMGVAPVYVARREPNFRLPALVSSAQAAPIQRVVPKGRPARAEVRTPLRATPAPARQPIRPAADVPRTRPIVASPALRALAKPRTAVALPQGALPQGARPTRTAHQAPGRFPG